MFVFTFDMFLASGYALNALSLWWCRDAVSQGVLDVVAIILLQPNEVVVCVCLHTDD